MLSKEQVRKTNILKISPQDNVLGKLPKLPL